MRKHVIGRWCVVLVLSSTLSAVTATVTTVTQAGAAVHKKHPAKHKKKGSSSSASKQLKALASGVAAEKTATFEVTYTTSTAGHTESVTFAQSPPKYAVKVGPASSFIYTGNETLYCSGTTCFKESGKTNPLVSLEDLFSPTTAKAFFDETELEIGTKVAGYSVSFSSETFGGLSSECATVSGHGQTEKDCVAKNGLLTYAGSSAGSVTLTSYTSSVPATLFEPPSGATVITEPST